MSAEELSGLDPTTVDEWIALSPTEEAIFLAVGRLSQPEIFPWGGAVIDHADEHYHSMSERQGYRALTNLTDQDFLTELDPDGKIDYYEITEEGEQLLQAVRDEMRAVLE
ncbi:helix-turn-helix domain-containing protein [Halomicrobium katesii]|uniref:hypothetical protein n=1 Tax=Halomicrobium katesii TaxID=437163 RepID=UPI00037A9A25|nr:hypothetical protein [Halomicrobium katesii]